MLRIHRQATVLLATVCALISCAGTTSVQTTGADVIPPAGQSPRFPTTSEMVAAVDIRVLGGYSIVLPARERRCWNGNFVQTVVECVTRETAVGAISLKEHLNLPATPADACPALYISWRGGRSPVEASPFPGLFDPEATLAGRYRAVGICCYRVPGHCPDSPSDNVR